MASALIDTNLILLLVVGLTDRNYIKHHKHTRRFSEDDFDRLTECLAPFSSLWVTSHCLAEVSNLLKQTNENMAHELLLKLREFGCLSRESHIPKDMIWSNENFLRLGVADTGFVQKSKRVNCSFTVDHDLYQTISKLGRKVVNLHHLA